MKRFLLLALLLTLPAMAASDEAVFTKHHRDFHQSLGLKKAKDQHAIVSDRFLKADAEIPADFDMRVAFGPLPGIMNQGQCGSCVEHSVTGNYEYSLAIRGLLPAGAFPLAAEQLMNCGNTGQCEGDNFLPVAQGLVRIGGLVPTSAYPYTARDQSCRSVSAPLVTPIKSASLITPNPQSIGNALFAGYPVSNTIAAGAGGFMNYVSGLYNQCQHGGTDHQVFLVGIHCQSSTKVGSDGKPKCAWGADGDTVNHDGYYDLVNSWGSQDWGEGEAVPGTMRIPIHGVNGRPLSGNLCNEVAEEVGILETGVPMPTPVPPTPPTPPIPPGSNFPWWIVAAVAGILGLGVLVGFLIFRKK